jgi:RNA polymerase sigma factor (sigma-70 family)
MGHSSNHTDLVIRAQRGDKESLERLAELTSERLSVYVYRLTLRNEWVADIVQESITEMLRMLGNLQKPDRFWPWVYKITLNKIRHHHRSERRQRADSLAKARFHGYDEEPRNRQEAVQKMVGNELKQLVYVAMAALKPRHRAVLTMRCYDEMTYSSIAETMGCSEFAARVLFYRAKKALEKQLSRNGLHKGALLTALVLFGKMTSSSEAAAANITVSAAACKVGVAAGVAGALTGKAALVALTAAGTLTVGSMVATSGPEKSQAVTTPWSISSPYTIGYGATAEQAGSIESWFYFPEGKDGPVFIRQVETGSFYSKLLQDQSGNYCFDSRRGVRQCNNRMWIADGSVMRLPTDSEKVSNFISRVEKVDRSIGGVRANGSDLLVVTGRNESGTYGVLRVERQPNIQDVEYFRYSFPGNESAIDERDEMHRRGWTYFTVSGSLCGKQVSGEGRIPFVYSACKDKSACLNMRLAGGLQYTDGPRGAFIRNSEGKIISSYPRGAFFVGLSRPWMGLHTIDTVRRDAANAQIWFETRGADQNKAEVTVTCERMRLVYTIDMLKDVVESITFSGTDDDGQAIEGELRFSYIQDPAGLKKDFVEPAIRSTSTYQEPPALWLVDMADEAARNEF